MLYAVNPRLGKVVEVDVATGPRIRRTATIPVTPGSSRGPLDRLAGWLVPSASAKEGVGPAAAALSADDKTLFVAAGRGLLAIDTGTLQVRARLADSLTFTSLLADPAGAQLFAVTGERYPSYALRRLDAGSGADLGELGGAALNPRAVVYVEPPR